MTRNFTTLALALATLNPLPVLAHSPSAVPTRTVAIADLDLASSSGRRALTTRVDAAVRQVCGDADARDLPATIERRHCLIAAHASADRAVQVTLAARGTKLARASLGGQ